jgi:ribose 5-phosphate isomerase B
MPRSSLKDLKDKGMRVGVACDHGGFELKEELKAFLKSLGAEPMDMGTFSEASVDYPDFGVLVAEKVSRGELEKGILICGTGIGMSMVANKFPRVRAALANDLYSSRCSREHNDANILVIGGRIVGKELAKEIVKVWLETPFAEGRHKRRLEKIEAIEKEKFKNY